MTDLLMPVWKVARLGALAVFLILSLGSAAPVCSALLGAGASAQTSGGTSDGTEKWCCCGACCGWSVNCDVIPGCLTC